MVEYSRFLTKSQRQKIENFPIEKRWNEFTNCDFNIYLWNKFWTEIYKGKKTDCVLDFGCGTAWDCHIARHHGYKDFYNLDIDTDEVKRVFGRYHEVFGFQAQYWEGEIMPYDDNQFDSIVSKASITKLRRTDWQTVLKELLRVSKPNAKWYIAPTYMIPQIPFKDQLSKIKNIEIVPWDWAGGKGRDWVKPKS